MPKKYTASVDYEKKLKTVMDKLGVDAFNYDWSRRECFIEFTYKGQLYRFEHSLDKAKNSGQKIVYISDCFAQLVLALEDLARIQSRGIYELSSWIEGMKALPKPKDIPHCFLLLGFTDIPKIEDVKVAYKKLVMVYHPDKGGDCENFNRITRAKDECILFLEKGGAE